MSYSFKDIHWSREINIKRYLMPQTLAEALDLLAEYDGEAQVIAGGTDIIPQLRHGNLSVDTLIDISCLPDISTIHQDADTVILGGLVTHSQVANSTLVGEKATALADASASVGSPQIRNIATIAGNLANGHPAADAAMPLLALNASVTIASQNGDRVVPLSEFFLGKGKTALDPRREILTKIHFTAPRENEGNSFLRLSKRGSLTIAVLIFAAVIEADKEKNVIKDARIALGPVAAVPLRASKTEEFLRGAPITAETLRKAAESVCMESNPLSDPVWGSAEYKKEMIKVFTKRGLKQALNQIDITVN
jgi:CO/xanthine dehydrogenase FAD-binding subunit